MYSCSFLGICRIGLTGNYIVRLVDWKLCLHRDIGVFGDTTGSSTSYRAVEMGYLVKFIDNVIETIFTRSQAGTAVPFRSVPCPERSSATSPKTYSITACLVATWSSSSLNGVARYAPRELVLKDRKCLF
jgi:hypothetical protein